MLSAVPDVPGDPLPVKMHGNTGYANGCRCQRCITGRQRFLDRQEARKSADAAHNERLPRKGAGKLERATVLEINSLNLNGFEYERWREVAIMSAGAVDLARKDGKLHLIAQLTKTLEQAMDRIRSLKAVPVPSGEGKGAGDADFVARYLQTQPGPAVLDQEESEQGD